MVNDVIKIDLLFDIHFTGCMICVQLPKSLYCDVGDVTYDKAEIIQNLLFHRFNIEVSLYLFNFF